MKLKSKTRIALLAGTALLSSASFVNAEPLFQITVKKVVDKDGQSVVQEGAAEKVQTKAAQRVVKKRRVAVKSKAKPKKQTKTVSPFKISRATTPEGVDTTVTGSVTAVGSPRFEERSFVRVIPAEFEERRPIDIKTVFDGLDANPVLNVHTVDKRSAYQRGPEIGIRGVWNYSAFINTGEVRIFRRSDALDGQPLMRLALDGYREAILDTNDVSLPDELVYMLRVYDADGRFDETKPRNLSLTSGNIDPNKEKDKDPILVLEDVNDFAAKRNIAVEGGSVIIRGSNVSGDEDVAVLGTQIRVSDDGEFEAQEILPYGDHTIPIDISGPRARLVEREMHIPKSEWFYVGHADLTVGKNISRRSQYASGKIDVIGKGGLYLKGKVKGKYLITASVDTEEDEPEHLLSNVTKRKADGLLNRIDPDKYYPVFGDDASIKDDAPTRSNLYVRIDRGDDHVMWGSYDVNIRSADLVELNRGLYGAKAQHKSKKLTSRGENRTEATIYAVSLDTVANYEVLTGTGGTVYRFSRQDIQRGSARLQVEVRNATTDTIVNTISLQEGRDYTIDHLQGRVILAQPVQSHVQNANAVIGVNDTVVVAARYEYIPAQVELDGYSIAGRASHWITDNVRIGVTGQTEKTDTVRRDILGADVLIKKSAKTWIKAEVAQSTGPARASNGSIDGGLSYVTQTATSTTQKAKAYRVEGSVDLAEVTQGGLEGEAGAYYEQFDSGFSGRVLRNPNKTQRWGASASIGKKETANASVSYDETKVETEGHKRLVSGRIQSRSFDNKRFSIGGTHDWVAQGSTFAATGLLPQANRFGMRNDVTARLDYELVDQWSAYIFGTTTVNRTGNRRRNDKVGIGAAFDINEHLKFGAGVSYGNNGFGGDLELSYQKDDVTSLTFGYAFVNGLGSLPELGGLGSQHQHALKMRGNRKINEHVSIFSESSFGLFNGFRMDDTNNAFGMEVSPNDKWKFTALVDSGLLDYSTNNNYRRNAVSLGADYSGEKLKLSAALEARFDRGQNRDADLWSGRLGGSYKANDDWTIQASVDATRSDGLTNTIADSRYLKVSAAGAYRPVDNDAFNGLFKYVHVADLSPQGQIGTGGFNNLPNQRSHVLSADGSYDVTDKLTVGAKYAYRFGEIALSRGSNNFARSEAQLGVLRADYALNDKWEILLEGRVFDVHGVDRDFGALGALWYNVNDKVKVGGGYSFSKFSNNLTDLSENNDGWFVNVAARF